MALHLLQKAADVSIHHEVEHDIWLVVPDLRRQGIIQPTFLSYSRNPWNYSSTQTELPSAIRGQFQPMLLGPGPLHRFVIYIDVMSLMAELVQIAGVKANLPEQALDPSLHLLSIRVFFQTQVLCIEPIQEIRIIRVKDKKTHTHSPLYGISNHWLLAMVRR